MGIGIDERDDVQRLLARIKDSLVPLQSMLDRCSGEQGSEDPVYRFYHQSWKVFGLQIQTEEIVSALATLAPGRALNDGFLQIIREGTGQSAFDVPGADWVKTARPILEAHFHARFFLEMAVRYGRQLPHPPRLLPAGWAALLALYDLR